jgi:hypothetical protein
MLHDNVNPAPDWRLASGSKTAAHVRDAEMELAEIFDGIERRSALGHLVKAHHLHSMKALRTNERHAGIVYGAIMEELTSPGGVTELGVFVQSGSAGGGCAIDRRLSMGSLRDRAWRAVPAEVVALNVTRRASKAKGSAVLGSKRCPKVASGVIVDDRRPIRARVLIDQVCVGGMSIRAVLAHHGWKESARSRTRLIKLLSICLAAISDAWNGSDRILAGDWFATSSEIG